MIGFLAYDKSKVEYVAGEVIHVKDDVHSQYTLDHFTISPEAYDAVGTSKMPKPWHNDFDSKRQGVARVETIGGTFGPNRLKRCKKLRIDRVLQAPELAKVNELCEKKYR